MFFHDVHCFFNAFDCFLNDIHTIGIHCFFMVSMSCVNVFMLCSHFFTTGFVAFLVFQWSSFLLKRFESNSKITLWL